MVNADKAFVMQIIRIKDALSALTMAGSVGRTGLPCVGGPFPVMGNVDKAFSMWIIRIKNALSALTMAGSVSRTGLPGGGGPASRVAAYVLKAPSCEAAWLRGTVQAHG